MKAATNRRYGSPEVLTIEDIDRPQITEDQVLVAVQASPVSQGDRRLRSADFPGISALPGRLMMGVSRPKNPIPGTVFAGRVVEVGAAVTRWQVGDDIFGSCDHSAHAEYLAVAQDGPMARMPAGMGYAEAAAVPYGAVTALLFLRDHAQLVAGQQVLVIGAAGGVGRYVVQLARHMGATVTGVCSARSFDLVGELGADHVIDYHSQDFSTCGQRFDVVFDTIGVSSLAHSRPALTPTGRYLSLIVSLRLLFDVLLSALTSGPKAIFGVALGDQRDMDQVRDLVERGAIRPVIARRFPLDRIAEAHAHLEQAGGQGAVVVDVGAARGGDGTPRGTKDRPKRR